MYKQAYKFTKELALNPPAKKKKNTKIVLTLDIQKNVSWIPNS